MPVEDWEGGRERGEGRWTSDKADEQWAALMIRWPNPLTHRRGNLTARINDDNASDVANLYGS